MFKYGLYNVDIRESNQGEKKMSHPDYLYDFDNSYDDDSDDAYDAAKDAWCLGDEPMTGSQRREQESWDETCRQNGW